MARDATRRHTVPLNQVQGVRVTKGSIRRHTTFVKDLHSRDPTKQTAEINGAHQIRKSGDLRKSHASNSIDMSDVQSQIEGYQQQLNEELSKEFADVTSEIASSMTELSTSFDEKCTTLESCSEVINTPLSQEIVDFGSDERQELPLGEVFTVLRDQLIEKRTQLHDYWTEYVRIQTAIKELAYVILDDEDVVLDLEPDEQGEVLEVNLASLTERRDSYLSVHSEGIEDFDILYGEIEDMRRQLIEEGVGTQGDIARRVKSFKDNMRKCLQALDSDKDND